MRNDALEKAAPSKFRYWSRLLLRIVVYSSLSVYCLFCHQLHCVLRESPEAFEHLLETPGWIPLDSLSEEARAYLEADIYRAHFQLAQERRIRHWEFPDPYGIHSGFLYKLTLQDELIHQLVAGHRLPISPLQKLEVEDILVISWETEHHKEHVLFELLRIGHISPARYRELREFLLTEVVGSRER